MKVFIYILIVLALGLIIYNLTQVNYNDPFNGDSVVALITVLAGFCAVLLLVILLTARKIKDTLKRK